MPVGPKDIRIIRTDSLVDMGTPASTDQVIIRDVTDGVLKYAQVSDVGITDHGGLAGLADFTADHGTSHDSHDHSTAMSTVVLNDLSDLTITTPSTADIVYYDGAGWVNQALAASDIQSGTFADARIAESNVTQHQAALSITESQISNLTHYTTSDFNTDFAASNLQALSNVTVTSVTNDDIIAWSGTEWTNQTAAEAGLATDTHVHDTSDVTTGTFANARISEASVTQHQAALSITESQISDLSHTTDHGALAGLTDNDHPQYQEIVNHGATASTARPAVLGKVMWIGSVQPTNLQTDDLWLDTDDASINTSTLHNSLNGLTSGDPHTQYLDVTRHDADDHSGLLPIDHGTNVTGLLDDDHTIYLLASGGRSMTGDLNLGGNAITNYADKINALGNQSGTILLVPSNGEWVTMTVTAATTLDFTNLSAGQSLLLDISQDATGSWAVGFTQTVVWEQANAWTHTGTANSRDRIMIDYDGTTYTGHVIGLDYS